MSKYLNLKYLKENSTRDPYFHGLGCIRVILNDIAINFYVKGSETSKYIHTHKSRLICTPLVGTYNNVIYDYYESVCETEYALESIECKQGTTNRVLINNVVPFIKKVEKIEEECVHDTKTFHDIHLNDDIVITKMVYDFSEKNDKALLLRNKNDAYVCGLSDRGDPEIIWNKIQKIIDNINEV